MFRSGMVFRGGDGVKTNPKQIICDEAERLWEIYMKTKEPVDYSKYIRHIKSCPEDFIELKKNKAKE